MRFGASPRWENFSDAEMFGFRRLSDPNKSISVDPQRVIVKDDSSDSVVSDSHEEMARQEPETLRQKLHTAMETQAFHIAVVVLVLIDCFLVITELVLDIQVLEQENANCNGTATDKETSEITAVTVLHYLSISILSIFMIELMIKIPVFRMEFFRNKLEVFDGIVIIISFVLDILSLIYEEQFAVAQLIILLRMWRIVRVVNGVVLSVETQAKKKIEQQKLLREELEHELEKFRQYCAAQEKEIEVLRNALNKHGIKIEDDYVAEKPKLCLNQMDVVVEVNVAEKAIDFEGGEDSAHARKFKEATQGMETEKVTISDSDKTNSVQAEYHSNHSTDA